MLRDLKERMTGPPDFGIYLDCAARGRRLYGREGVDTEQIREAFGRFPLIGMLGGFELATPRGLPLLYTYTGVLLLARVDRPA
jgi:small ligand-binding sensory domain FIST